MICFPKSYFIQGPLRLCLPPQKIRRPVAQIKDENLVATITRIEFSNLTIPTFPSVKLNVTNLNIQCEH